VQIKLLGFLLVLNSKCFRDLFQLVSLVLSLKQRTAQVKFGHNRPNGKNVHWGVVEAFLLNHFGAAIPAGRCVLSIRGNGVHSFNLPEVTDLHLIIGDQNVLWLQVSVEVTLIVNEFDAF
jgi:hypothetical protein